MAKNFSAALLFYFGTEYCAKVRNNSAARLAKGTEGSNPPLSATQSVMFSYNSEIAQDPRLTRRLCSRCEPESASPASDGRISRICLQAQKSRFASRFEPKFARHCLL